MKNKIREIGKNKKLLLKIITGVLIIIISFILYFADSMSKNDEITIANSDENDVPITISTAENDINTTSDSVISTAEDPLIIVDVSGAVATPSVIKLKFGSRVYEAIDLAGGLTSEADTRNINLAQKVADGEKLYIPIKGEINDYVSNSFIQSNNSLINLNTADSETLQTLTGVGPSTAQKIIDYRTAYGTFKTIEDLKNVSGIGDKTFEKLKGKIKV